MTPPRDALAKMGWRGTPEELAEKTGKNRATVWRWLSGDLVLPQYAKTIIEQDAKIRRCARTVAKLERQLGLR